MIRARLGKNRSCDSWTMRGEEETRARLSQNGQCHGNLKIPSSDQELDDILLHIRSSKTPVSPSISFLSLFVL